MVADRGPVAGGGLRVAVLSGARLSASAPRSAAVARTRRAMREVVAADPDLVLRNGDLLRRGLRADMRFARRLIDEELAGKVNWRYLPGDGELAPSGVLSTFRSEFGNPVRVVDRKGTRLVLLNSARGSFRLGAFEQLVRLRSSLDAAARDASVHSVVVAAHHSTSDPMPGGSAELTDPREAELVEGLLADFRARSGKPVAYVGSHARRFATTRHDGVPQVLAGPVNRPAARVPGSFTGWSMIRVDDTEDLSVGFRPAVDRLRVDAPESLAVGRVAEAHAVLRQAGRRVRVDYPMQAQWLDSQAVHVGPASGAPESAVLAYAPGTGRVKALRSGTAKLSVRVNGRTAGRTVTVR